MRIIRTKYLKPSATQVARIKAVDVSSGLDRIVAYSFQTYDSHKSAAEELIRDLSSKTGNLIGSVEEYSKGYLFVYES